MQWLVLERRGTCGQGVIATLSVFRLSYTIFVRASSSYFTIKWAARPGQVGPRVDRSKASRCTHCSMYTCRPCPCALSSTIPCIYLQVTCNSQLHARASRYFARSMRHRTTHLHVVASRPRLRRGDLLWSLRRQGLWH